MYRFKFLAVLVLSVVMLALLPAQSVGAMTTTHFSLNGMGADAYFRTLDSSGCVETDAAVFGFYNAYRERRSDQEGSFADIVLAQYNYCTRTQLLYAATEDPVRIPDADFLMDKQLNAAKLNTTLTLCDVISGSCGPVTVNLTWTGVGPITTTRQSYQVKSASFISTFRSTGNSRDATLSGTVSGFGVSLDAHSSFHSGLGSGKEFVTVVSRE